jgi:uncharacterized protein YndB with AHSA1/START domain
MNATNATKLTVSATVNAPIAKVWQYWNDPIHIVMWNTASEDWHTPRAENDLRVGGSFTAHMAAKDGSVAFDFKGNYTEVIEEQKIEYTMEDGRQVTVLFEAIGNTTNVTEHFNPEDINSHELQLSGWQAILNSFKSYTERN